MSSTLYQLSYSLFGGEGDNRGASYQTHLIKEMTASLLRQEKPGWLRQTRITLLAAPPASCLLPPKAGGRRQAA
jgi:hypothetical protein